MHHDFKQDTIFLYQEMSQFLKKISTPVSILIILIAHNLHAQDSMNEEIWKKELQILLGFTGEQVDGSMGMETFNALKRFAYDHDLADVVLRGEFKDIEGWGFEQYLIKYHLYWIRELKNQRIFKDIHDKEYLRQADETLYTFEIAIQNAKLEVERLTRAKLREGRLAREKQEAQKWEIEKNEAERLTAELQESIIAAELEAEKWALERIRAQRFAEEKELLTRLEERKLEASILASDFEDVISVAKREIDRLIEENNKLKTFITTSTDTKLLAEELKTELKLSRMQLDSINVQKDSLEKKLHEIFFSATAKQSPPPAKKKKWFRRVKFGNKKKKVEESNPPSENNTVNNLIKQENALKPETTIEKESKLEALNLVSEFEDVISVAKREIDRLIEENNKIETLITTNTDMKLFAEEIKKELEVTRIQLDSLSFQKDSLEKTLQEIEAATEKISPPPSTEKKKWFKRVK